MRTVAVVLQVPADVELILFMKILITLNFKLIKNYKHIDYTAILSPQLSLGFHCTIINIHKSTKYAQRNSVLKKTEGTVASTSIFNSNITDITIKSVTYFRFL